MAHDQPMEIDSSRRLIGSPDWAGLGVLFDARSGDFWIMSNETKNVLLSGSISNTPIADNNVMENLIAHGIIQPLRTS